MRSVCELAAVTGISPRELLALDLDTLGTLRAVVIERSQP